MGLLILLHLILNRKELMGNNPLESLRNDFFVVQRALVIHMDLKLIRQYKRRPVLSS